MLAFQWLIVGNDAHAKNYGLLLQGRGRYLAPLYDACSWMPYRLPAEKISALRTAMKIGRNYRISSADQPTAMLHTADRLGLPADDLAASLRGVGEPVAGRAGQDRRESPARDGGPADRRRLPR